MAKKPDPVVIDKKQQLLDAITSAQKALDEAKAEYKAYASSNPEQVAKNPTPHELQKLQAKATEADHIKANTLYQVRKTAK